MNAFGLSGLAIANILMGNAIPTFDPSNPLAYTCGLDDADCATPVRLQGIPFSYVDQTTGDDEWSDVTYRANIDWTPNADTLVYASVTTGYRAGGYSLGIGDSRGPDGSGQIVPATYDKEEIVAYEIGYKGTFADGRLQVNSSIYHYDFDNYQDRTELFVASSGTSTDVVQNVDKAQNRGVEIELTWLPTDAWTIGGNGSWTDTEYKSDFFVLEDDNPDFPLPGNILSATLRFGVPYGVKVHRDKSLFSPSGSDRKVSFDIDTAVRGSVDSWELVISDQEGKVVRTVNGNGSPPEAFSWEGKDDDGRLVGDGSYEAKVVILDDVGQEWDYQTSVKVLGFRDRTRVPIRVEVSGSGKDQNKGKDR